MPAGVDVTRAPSRDGGFLKRATDIEVMMTSEGPTIILNGAAATHADEIGIEKLHIALSACRTHATAYVMATDEIE